MVHPTRSVAGLRAAAGRNRCEISAQYGSPGGWRLVGSRPSDASAPVRAMPPLVASPAQSSPRSAPLEMRPREGFSPTTPQHDAGMRMDPPPSPPWLRAHKPAATAAAAPPLEPPAVRVVSTGLRAGGNIGPSVIGRVPNSGAFVFPRMTAPSSFNRPTAKPSTCAIDFSNTRDPRLFL